MGVTIGVCERETTKGDKREKTEIKNVRYKTAFHFSFVSVAVQISARHNLFVSTDLIST